MKTDAAVLQSWDDLVFENRNKEYGAYCTRKSYAENINIGFATCLMAAAGVFAVYHLHSLLFANDVVPPIKTLVDGGIILPPPPTIIPTVEVQPPPSHSIKSTNTKLQVKVVTKSVETILPVTADPIFVDNPDQPVEGSASAVTGDPVAIQPAPMAAPKIVNYAEVMPAYDGGFEAMMRFISQKIKYPNSAKRAGIEGTTFIQFVINTEGKVTDVSIMRGFNAACDAEAARVIALMKNWKAGQQNNTAVSVRMVLPIKFKINDN